MPLETPQELISALQPGLPWRGCLASDEGDTLSEENLRAAIYLLADTASPVIPNERPVVDAGANRTTDFGVPIDLEGSASDDGFPEDPGALTLTWSKFSGPGTVTFGDPHAAETTADFSLPGTYILKLQADDGDLVGAATMIVTVVGDADSTAIHRPMWGGAWWLCAWNGD